jgi:uncharacterized membrane protein YvbJ
VTRENCPHCGADLPRGVKACPECGSCEKTGWSDETAASGLDIPDQDFDYEEFTQREFGKAEKVVPRGVSPIWWVVAVVILILVVLGFVF